jgi:hypothetical protein
MDKLETDKKLLQLKIQQPHSYNTVEIFPPLMCKHAKMFFLEQRSIIINRFNNQ